MPLRYLSIDDYDTIIDLWTHADLPIRPTGRDSYDNLSKQLQSKQVSILAYFEDSIIIGIVLLSHDFRKGWINRLAVRNEYKREGIGSKLLKASEEHFKSIGIEIFVALIDSENKSSKGLFKKNNYYLWEDNISYVSKRIRPDI